MIVPEKMQQTMLATWLLELYLQRLIYLPERDQRYSVDDGLAVDVGVAHRVF